jgi:type II secretory pathway component GspD/PulD (secretin)
VIAGLLNDTETSSMSGYPGLIHVPVAKYLFGQETKEKVQSEIVFAIIPHIVRSNEINDDNLKEIDLGAGNTVTYRKAGTK